MLLPNERDALVAILGQDRRPWPTVALQEGDLLAEVTLPVAKKADVALVVAEATALGFRVEREEKMLLSESSAAEALHYVVLAIQYVGGAAGVLVAIDKASSVVAEKIRKLKALLSKHRQETVYAPVAHLALVSTWLDARYGEGNWKYDPDAIEAKAIADVTVYKITEERTGTQHILATKGDSVSELGAITTDPQP